MLPSYPLKMALHRDISIFLTEMRFRRRDFASGSPTASEACLQPRGSSPCRNITDCSGIIARPVSVAHREQEVEVMKSVLVLAAVSAVIALPADAASRNHLRAQQQQGQIACTAAGC